MHAEAFLGYKDMLHRSEIDVEAAWRVLDLGGQNVNGTVHSLMPNAKYTVLDIATGPSVDITADACTWEPTELFDIVITTELFEHCECWDEVVYTASRALDQNGPGLLFITCASTNRTPHGSHGEGVVPAGQYYGNVDPEDLKGILKLHFSESIVRYQYPPGDVYAWARM